MRDPHFSGVTTSTARTDAGICYRATTGPIVAPDQHPIADTVWVDLLEPDIGRTRQGHEGQLGIVYPQRRAALALATQFDHVSARENQPFQGEFRLARAARERGALVRAPVEGGDLLAVQKQLQEGNPKGRIHITKRQVTKPYRPIEDTDIRRKVIRRSDLRAPETRGLVV
ncbi:hypothetical protein CEW88_04015 [Alloyangia pacifica]|uniref:Uncharacterized protein n=1 Tax=Alloyangia pacifica TaxID=311180 RepID=A0A2U8HAX1_9RHOB|nr:hypothetical protein CEW88_04015 [Alloyangia pacifica]